MTRFPCHVREDGTLVPVHAERTIRWRGKDVFVSVHEHPAPMVRSNPSNRRLWGVIYRAIAEETGNDPETLHQALKREAVRVGVLDPQYVLMGSTLLEDEPTTVVDQEAFQRYTHWLEEGCETGSLLGVQIHIPEEFEG